MFFAKKMVEKVLWSLFPNKMADNVYEKAKTKGVEWWGKLDCYTDIEKNCKIFLSKEQLDNAKQKRKVVRDIIISYEKYGMTANEYFSYGFPQKGNSERATYLSRKQKDILCMNYSGENWADVLAQLKDKNKFYSIAASFFKRKACKVDCDNDRADFKLFCQGMFRFIAKPSRGACGRGVEIISLQNGNVDSVFDYLRSNGSYIVEDLVRQDSRMAEWNDSSVNTIRVASVKKEDVFQFLFSVMRVGRKGSVVDNAGSGGCFAVVDFDSGCIITDGYDEFGRIFKKHPESNKTFMNFKIPEWESLQKLVREVHAYLPAEHRYVGFDFALSENGWVLIEGNWGDFIMPQTALGRGFYKDFKNAIMLK